MAAGDLRWRLCLSLLQVLSRPASQSRDTGFGTYHVEKERAGSQFQISARSADFLGPEFVIKLFLPIISLSSAV